MLSQPKFIKLPGPEATGNLMLFQNPNFLTSTVSFHDSLGSGFSYPLFPIILNYKELDYGTRITLNVYLVICQHKVCPLTINNNHACRPAKSTQRYLNRHNFPDRPNNIPAQAYAIHRRARSITLQPSSDSRNFNHSRTRLAIPSRELWSMAMEHRCRGSPIPMAFGLSA